MKSPLAVLALVQRMSLVHDSRRRRCHARLARRSAVGAAHARQLFGMIALDPMTSSPLPNPDRDGRVEPMYASREARQQRNFDSQCSLNCARTLLNAHLDRSTREISTPRGLERRNCGTRRRGPARGERMNRRWLNGCNDYNFSLEQRSVKCQELDRKSVV